MIKSPSSSNYRILVLIINPLNLPETNSSPLKIDPWKKEIPSFETHHF